MFVEKALLQASLWGISAIFAAPAFAAQAIPVDTSFTASVDNANSQISLKGPLGPCTVSGGLRVAPQFRVVD
jgi:hypothetical protein